MREKSNNIKALKSGVWYTVSSFFSKSIVFLSTPVFTRLLTKKEFGAFNNYLSWVALLMIFVTLNLDSTLISARFDFKEKFDSYILSVLFLSSLSGMLWITVININRVFFQRLFDLPITYINIMLVYLIFYPATTLFQAREQYFFEYKKNIATSMFISVCTTLLSVVLVYCLSDRLLGRILGAIIPTVIVGFLFFIYFIRKGEKINLSYWKYALPIALPYIPHLLSMTVLNSVDKVMINRFCGAEETALYSLAYTCGTLMVVLLTSVNNAFAPWLGEKLDGGEFNEIRKVSYLYISLFFSVAIGIMLVSPEILYILGGKSYMESVYVLAPVAMGCCCQFLYTMFVNVEQFKRKTIGMAIGSICAAVLNFVLNMIFIPKFGYLAAAYTTLVGYLFLVIIHMYLVKRLGLQKVYSYKFITLIILFGMIFMVIITVLYSHKIIRYSVLFIYILILLLLIIKYKNKYLPFLKKGGT